MKKVVYIILSLLTSAIVHAQSLDAVVKGSTDSNETYLLLSWEELDGLARAVDTLQVRGEGTFKHQVKLSEPTIGFLILGDRRFTVWLSPGGSTELHMKEGKPQFSGSAGVYAAYFLEDQVLLEEKYKEYERKNPGFDKGSSRFSNSYFAIMDSITSARLSFLKRSFDGSSREEQQFVDFQTNALIYSNLYYKVSYEGSDIRRFKFYQLKHNIEEGNAYGFSDKVEMKDTRLLSNPYYNGFVTQLIANIALARVKSDGGKFAIEPYVDFAMLAVDDLTEGAATAPKLKALLLNKLVQEIDREKKRAWIGKASATLADLSIRYGDKSINLVEDKLSKVVDDQWFMKGDQAPAFTLKDRNGKMYSLKDFKGKKVYLDLGASWCKPCIEGIPAWNDLVEENESKGNIVFVSLSLDDREDQWQRWVKKYHPKGLLLYAGEGGFKSKFAKDYNVKAIPHFILLNEEGKIEAYSAPEPKDIRDMILPKK